MAERPDSPDPEIGFEHALEQLEAIVHELEDGRIGLAQALARYEAGVGLLRHCYQTLDRAERRIELLTAVDDDGRPRTEPFDDPSLSLEEKSKGRTKRRSRKGAEPAQSENSAARNAVPPTGEIDVPGTLF